MRLGCAYACVIARLYYQKVHPPPHYMTASDLFNLSFHLRQNQRATKVVDESDADDHAT
jgi:hypothetical protein